MLMVSKCRGYNYCYKLPCTGKALGRPNMLGICNDDL